MLIRHQTLIKEDPFLLQLFTLGLILYLGDLENNKLLLDPVLKQNIGVLLKSLLKFFGFRLCSLNLEFFFALLQFIVIISVLSPKPTILFCVPEQNMKIDLIFVREKVLARQLKVQHIPAQDQWADALTKPLSPNWFLFLRGKLKVSVLPHAHPP